MGIRGQAQAPDIAGVGRDLGFDKDNVKHAGENLARPQWKIEDGKLEIGN